MSKKNHQKGTTNGSPFADNIAEDMSKEQNSTRYEANNSNETELNPDNLSETNTEEKLLKLNDSYLRLMAEYDNYRKRTLKEKADLIKNGGEKILSGLLPVMDDFQRALKTIDQSDNIEAIKEGVDLIYLKFMTFLQQNGVKPIEAVGKEFDEETSEAVALVSAEKEDQKGIVIDTVQEGYTLNEKVLRHAKVVVAN